MKFSLIIPVYNAENKLNRCVESIINRSYDDYELILVNDGSTDNSAEICRYYSNKFGNIKYIEKANAGASSARNAGMDAAEGDYILFVDSDDYVDSNYFKILSSSCIEDGLAVFTYTILKPALEVKRNIKDNLTDPSISNFEKTRLLILSRTINSPVAKVFSRKIINSNSIRFEENMPVAEDFNFCVKYLMKSREIKIFNESVYYYDVTNENSLVHKRKKGMIDVYPVVFDYAYETINQSHFSDDEKKVLFRIWDKLHTDSFVTCVMEEQKDEELTLSKRLSEIRKMCEKFYSKYKPIYGYENFVHFLVRFCIKHKSAFLLDLMCKIYNKIRG